MVEQVDTGISRAPVQTSPQLTICTEFDQLGVTSNHAAPVHHSMECGTYESAKNVTNTQVPRIRQQHWKRKRQLRIWDSIQLLEGCFSQPQ